ncbi:hypothetical protein ATANTOWER_012470 [Ataeniobius toweri]|uniref:Uncharacterized protein n=1 Tax=Ataeniobius toweri TaxID=208326 RepID=A0ABU7A284_9TELE|nr:hypothetical protein [Ataeniobius toweri]
MSQRVLSEPYHKRERRRTFDKSIFTSKLSALQHRCLRLSAACSLSITTHPLTRTRTCGENISVSNFTLIPRGRQSTNTKFSLAAAKT